MSNGWRVASSVVAFVLSVALQVWAAYGDSHPVLKGLASAVLLFVSILLLAGRTPRATGPVSGRG